MSLHFSANQYQNAFIPHKLSSWEVSKDFRERPDIKKAHDGGTKIVANDRGHLLPKTPKSAKCPWGSYVGTWDMPCPLPGSRGTVRTARSTYAQEALKHLHDSTQWTLEGWAKPCTHANSADGRRKPKPSSLTQIKIVESPNKHYSTKTYPKEKFPTERSQSQDSDSAKENVQDEEIAASAKNANGNKREFLTCDDGHIVAM